MLAAQLLLFTGVVLKELPVDVPMNGDGDDVRHLAVTHKFKDFTYWNLDLTPSANDKIAQVMKWIDIAKVVRYISINFLMSTGVNRTIKLFVVAPVRPS